MARAARWPRTKPPFVLPPWRGAGGLPSGWPVGWGWAQVRSLLPFLPCLPAQPAQAPSPERPRPGHPRPLRVDAEFGPGSLSALVLAASEQMQGEWARGAGKGPAWAVPQSQWQSGRVGPEPLATRAGGCPAAADAPQPGLSPQVEDPKTLQPQVSAHGDSEVGTGCSAGGSQSVTRGPEDRCAHPLGVLPDRAEASTIHQSSTPRPPLCSEPCHHALRDVRMGQAPRGKAPGQGDSGIWVHRPAAGLC